MYELDRLPGDSRGAVFGRSGGARRHLLAFAGTSILAAGMVAVGQGRL
jgi:hypothetical protein